MIDKKLAISRLTTVADFLQGLNHESFNYSKVVDQWSDDNECGTVCCAMGWFPAIFPEDFKWRSRNGIGVIFSGKEGVRLMSMALTAEYFGVSIMLAGSLFLGDGFEYVILSSDENKRQEIERIMLYYNYPFLDFSNNDIWLGPNHNMRRSDVSPQRLAEYISFICQLIYQGLVE